MPTANNTGDIKKMILKEMRKAMQVIQKKVEADMYEETGDYYTGGEPKKYERTGALGDTPNVTAISDDGNGFSFQAYLDESHNYTTGDNPNMTQVLNLANYGIPWTTKSGRTARATVGKKGFWERSEEKIQKTIDETMGKFFN